MLHAIDGTTVEFTCTAENSRSEEVTFMVYIAASTENITDKGLIKVKNLTN